MAVAEQGCSVDFCRSYEQTSVHPTQGTDNRLKKLFSPIPLLRTNDFIGVMSAQGKGYLEEGE